jgi:uracil-DNA glycosylase
MPDIALLGEARGEQEEREQRGFVGPTGWELNRMLGEAGINRKDCFITNVFNFRPPGNKIEALCTTKPLGIPGYPAIGQHGYIHRQFKGELDRLADEIVEVNPNVIIALGNTASWAVLGKTAISKIRGTVQMTDPNLLVEGYKVLPTFHPAAIFRQWSIRPVTIMDLIKGKRESQYPEIRRPERQIWIEPTLEDIYEFDRLHIRKCRALAVDIETSRDAITCIGFAPRADLAIVIPGVGIKRAGRPYWPSMDVERNVLKIVKDILERPVPKIFQNGLYDIAFIYRAWKIGVIDANEDTMLLHHALQPESLKSLGFLGSVYTDEGAWKQMRERVTTIKRDD